VSSLYLSGSSSSFITAGDGAKITINNSSFEIINSSSSSALIVLDGEHVNLRIENSTFSEILMSDAVVVYDYSSEENYFKNVSFRYVQV
jgi:hypothetical protein